MKEGAGRSLLNLAGVLVLACAGCGNPGSAVEPRPAAESPAPPSSPPAEVTPAAPPPAPPVQEARKEPRPASRPAPSVATEREPTATPARSVPEVQPEPPPIVKTLPAGTSIGLIFLDGLSSETAKVGDTFRARVAQDVTNDGMVLISAGSVVRGDVTEVESLKKIGGTARLGMRFHQVELTNGRTVSIEANVAQQGKSETKKDAATIGGAAAGGALLGRIVGKHGKDALLGAVVGGAVGTAVAAKTKGEQVEIPVGTELSIELNQPVDVTVRR